MVLSVDVSFMYVSFLFYVCLWDKMCLIPVNCLVGTQ